MKINCIVLCIVAGIGILIGIFIMKMLRKYIVVPTEKEKKNAVDKDRVKLKQITNYEKLKKDWIYDIFDSVYIITLPERLTHIKYITQMMKFKPSIFDALDQDTLDYDLLIKNGIVSSRYYSKHNHGRIACHLSHLEVMRKFLERKEDENCLIFEDDIGFPVDITYVKKYMEKVMQNVPKNWDIIYFGRCYDSYHNKLVNEFLIQSLPLCRHAYVVSKKGARAILNNTIPMVANGDIMCRKMMKESIIISYSTVLPLFFQEREKYGSALNNKNFLKIYSHEGDYTEYVDRIIEIATDAPFEENLYTNWEGYRLADTVLAKKYRNEEDIKIQTRKFPNSIASEYIRRTNKVNNLKLLLKIVKSRSHEIELPMSDEIVVHIRGGDVLSNHTIKEFLTDYQKNSVEHLKTSGNYVKPLLYYYKKVKNSGFRKVTLVSGSHRKKNLEKSLIYLKCLKIYFELLGFQVHTRFGKNPDEDFIYMCGASVFCPAGGGFSDLISKLVNLGGGVIL